MEKVQILKRLLEQGHITVDEFVLIKLVIHILIDFK